VVQLFGILEQILVYIQYYGAVKGLNILSFEPSALNTFLISKNIEINGLVDRVTLYPIAISDKSEFGYLNMSSTDLGGAFNEFSDREIESVGDGAYRRDVLFKPADILSIDR